MEILEENKDLVAELTIKFLVGDITIEEMSLLESMLKTDKSKNEQFLEFKKAWHYAGNYHNFPESQQSWEKLNQKIGTAAVSGSRKKTPHLFTERIKRAALWLLLVSAGATGMWMVMNKNNARTAVLCEISTPLGSRSHIILPDGTEVWLNAGTKVQYPGMFSTNHRDVFLTGEAYFKVKSNKSWPFIVHTSDVQVKALGTIFNVKAYPSEKEIVTTLVEGVVVLENEAKVNNKLNFTLKPKEKLTYYKQESFVKQNIAIASKAGKLKDNATGKESIVVNKNFNTDLSTSWKDSRWIINGEKIDNLVVMLERRYGVKINILSAELTNYKFTGTIENETLEQVLKYLKLTIPVDYEVKKGFIDLKINEVLKNKYKSFLKNYSD